MRNLAKGRLNNLARQLFMGMNNSTNLPILSTKSRKFAFAISTDIIKNSFSIKNSYYKKIRNDLFKNMNKSSFIKDIFFNVADRGLKF